MTLLAGFLMSSQALAQGAPPSSQQETADAGTDIVVTGSRIARPDLEGTSPVAVVGAADIALKAGSANVENVLNDLPQVTATQSGTSNNPGGGVATVNLRNLGSQRTLVLVDGRRYMSYDVNQVVDLNTVPSALISRVDVVTGGQSAVYGSDAIAGVVNFVLKRDFSGVELGTDYRVTGRGDGQIWNTYGIIGANFDDGRGNVTLFADYTKRKAVLAGARSFSRTSLGDNQDGSPLSYAGSGSVPQGRVLIPGLNAALGNGCAATAYQIFNDDGSSRCYGTADSYDTNPVNYLQVPQERFLVSAMAQYEINEHVTPYIEAQFANNRVDNLLAATPLSQGTPFGDGTVGPLTIQTASPFLSPALRTALGSLDTDGDGYVSAPQWNYRSTQLGGRLNQDERNAFRVVTGFKGDIAAGFSYDAYYMYARTKNSQRQDGNVALDRFLAGTTTAFDASGNLVCRDAARRAEGCVPVNIFGLNQLSPEAADYIRIGATNLEEYTTQVASFVVTNPSLFDLGAGGVGIAAGAEWRKESGSITPDQYLASGNVGGFNPGQPTGGSYSVREFFGEVRIPLLKDTIVHRLELNGAARATHYSNAPGNVFTWSAGAELAPIPDLTFRGQYQRAIRGPSVNELFLGNTVSFEGNADQCGTPDAVSNAQLNAICVAQFNGAGAPVNLIGNGSIQSTDVNPLTFTGGNANLREERAKTFTVGGVFRPSFLPRFSMTVDYYDIKISGYIAPVPTSTIGSLCFDSYNDTYCNLISRNSAGQIETFASNNLNSGGLKTSGIDVTAGYTQPLGMLFGADDARLSFSFNGTRLMNYKYTPVIGVDQVIDCEGRFGAQCAVPTPKWRHTMRTTLGVGPAALSLQWRYLGSSRDDNDEITYAVERFKATNYFDLTGTVDVNDNLTFNLGVSNLFDKDPPIAASTQSGGNGEQSNTYPTFYDVLGRTFFVSARVRF
jgi:outer membrane receptor protein involved in Fe transport